MSIEPKALLDVIALSLDSIPPESAWLLSGQALAWAVRATESGEPLRISDGVTGGLTVRSILEHQLRSLNRGSFTKRIFETEGHVLSLLTDATLTELINTANEIHNYSIAQLRELADAWWERGADKFPQSTVQLRLAAADMLSNLLCTKIGTGAKDRPKIHCPHRGADTFAVSVMRAGGVPEIEQSSDPIMTSIYHTITGATAHQTKERTRSLLDFFSPGGFLPQCDARFVFDIDGETRTLPKQAASVASDAFKRAELTIAVLPHRLTYSPGSFARLREMFVESGHLSAVFSMPPGLLIGSSHPFSVLVFQSTRCDAVLFCDFKAYLKSQGRFDASAHAATELPKAALHNARRHPDSRSSVLISVDDIRKHAFDLSPERHINRHHHIQADNDRDEVRLADVAEVLKPQFIRTSEDGERTTIHEVSLRDIPESSYISGAVSARQIQSRDIRLYDRQVLRSGDILLSVKGVIGVVGLVTADIPTSQTLFASQAFVIIRLHAASRLQNLRYLVMYLRSNYVQRRLAVEAVGSPSNIPLDRIRDLPVWMAPSETQEAFAECFDAKADIEKIIMERRKEQRQLEAHLWVTYGISN